MPRVNHTSETTPMLLALQWLELCIENKTAHQVSSVDMGHYSILVYSAPDADYLFAHSNDNSFSSMTIIYKDAKV